MFLKTKSFLMFLCCAGVVLSACEQTIYQPFPVGEGYRFHKPLPRKAVRPGVADEIDGVFEARWRNVANQVALQILNDTRGVVDNFYLQLPDNPSKMDLFLDYYLREAFTNLDFTVLTRPTEGVIVRPYTDSPTALGSSVSTLLQGDDMDAEVATGQPLSDYVLQEEGQKVIIGYVINDNGVIIAEANSTYILPTTNPGEYLPWQLEGHYED